MEESEQIKKAFGEVIREVRLEKNISQEELAALSGIDRSYVSLIERGINSPSLVMIFNLCSALGVSPSEVLSRVEKNRSNS